MFSKSDSRLFRTLRFRLMFFYAGLSFVMSALAFLLIYLNLGSMLRQTVDEELHAEIREWEALYRELGLEGLTIEFREEARVLGEDQVVFRFLAPDLRVLAASDLKNWEGLPPPPGHLLDSGNYGPETDVLDTIEIPGIAYGVRVIWSRMESGNLFQFGVSLEKTTHILADYREVFLIAALAMLIAGGVAGTLMARRAVKGLDKIADGVKHVTEGDFSKRILLTGEGEELENLGGAFNHMQDRVQSLIRELKEVTNNVAHDLRSPMTRIRGAAETALTKEHTLQECRETLGIVIEESDRLVSMIDTMLVIAEAESGTVDYTGDRVELSVIIREAVELFRIVAEECGVSLETDLPDEPVRMMGDTQMLQRVVANLLDNAIKYTPEGGKVCARLSRTNGDIIMEVADTGAGIPDDDLPKVFDRFFRGDSSRSSPGNGLGLSYVKSIVRAHGGAVSVRSAPGGETVFRLHFKS